MRIIWTREFGRLFAQNLTSQEQQQYADTFSNSPSSLEELRALGDVQLPLFLKAMRYKCVEAMRRFQEESWKIFAAVYGEHIDAYLADKQKQKGNPQHESELRKLSRRYARNRQCHMHLRGFTCYCDEHSH